MVAHGPITAFRCAILMVALTVAVGGAQGQERDGAVAGSTPMGAIRAGDSHRFIPEWTGGFAEPVKDALPGRLHPDPFFEEGRWFTVGPADLARYRVRMSAGMRELLTRFPRFEVPLFLTRRTAAAPPRIYAATQENATRATLQENGLVVRGAAVGVPFPVPRSGAEAMWNHLLRWRGVSMVRTIGVVIPDALNVPTAARYREQRLSAYAAGLDAPHALYYRRTALAAEPAAGGDLAVADSIDPISRPRAAWYRPPGKTRAVAAPDFVYDTPDPATGGIVTADMLDMFSGMMDRFDFTLVERRSMYVPYNAYRLTADSPPLQDLLWADHPNPAFVRYELHRVWVVEATLKTGFRHAFPHRTYYLDEDSWQILMAEHYDRSGRLARYAEAHGITDSRVPVFAPVMEVVYDFIDNRYVVVGLDGNGSPPDFRRRLSPDAFTREALEATAVRRID